MNNFELKCQFALIFLNFPIKLLKSGFVASVKYREEPGFGMLHYFI